MIVRTFVRGGDNDILNEPKLRCCVGVLEGVEGRLSNVVAESSE